MRILVSQPTGDKRGHYGLYTANVCQALAAQGHEVTLCTNRIDPDRYLHGSPQFRVVEVGRGRLDFARFDAALPRRPWRFYAGYLRNSYAVTAAAAHLCRRERFDVVLALDTEYLIAALLLRRYRRILPPVAVCAWASNFTYNTYAGSPAQRAYKVVQREVLRTALGREIRALVVLTDWHRDMLRTQLRLGAEFPIVVVPDGGEVYRDLPARETARARLGLPTRTTIFMLFGLLRRDKGIEYLIKAAARLPAGQAIVLVAGAPMEYTTEQVKALVDAAGATDRVQLRLGYVPDTEVAWHFATCDAVVFPYTRAYTGGTGPLMKGACSYGRPVIATDVAGMGRLVREHALGLVAQPDDGVSLAETLGQFLALDGTVREAMAANARALAEANSWEVLAVRYAGLFEAIAPPYSRTASMPTAAERELRR